MFFTEKGDILILRVNFIVLGEFISVKTNCPHVNIAINLNSIRKAVQSNGGFTSLNCLTCKANVDGDVGKIEVCFQRVVAHV